MTSGLELVLLAHCPVEILGGWGVNLGGNGRHTSQNERKEGMELAKISF